MLLFHFLRKFFTFFVFALSQALWALFRRSRALTSEYFWEAWPQGVAVDWTTWNNPYSAPAIGLAIVVTGVGFGTWKNWLNKFLSQLHFFNNCEEEIISGRRVLRLLTGKRRVQYVVYWFLENSLLPPAALVPETVTEDSIKGSTFLSTFFPERLKFSFWD